MERTIAYYCAPALAGIKPANIVACHKSKISDINQKIRELNIQMNGRDIYFETLFECENRILVMVYRKKLLRKTLMRKDIKLFLGSFGYPVEGSVEELISHLKSTMSKQEFPHEIGAFLGYPIHDIQGFLYHKNQGCLLCGEWKVYKDVERAKMLFDRFASCRRAVIKRVLRGQTLAQIFCAA